MNSTIGIQPRQAQNRQRAVLYLRQSISREESISLELQEFEGRAYCERRGYEVVDVRADPGLSGRSWSTRPEAQNVVQMVQDGIADVIVVWKWSRFARSRLDWAVAVDGVERMGGSIESATEPVDTSTSSGRLARGMLAEFAAFESDRIGEMWRETHARRLRNGLPINGRPRFGYSYTRETGFTPDPVSGPILTELYQRFIAGESVYVLAKDLNERRIPTPQYGSGTPGNWTPITVRRILDSGFAAGLIRSHDEHLKGAHDPLISEDEWATYLEARQRRRSYKRAISGDFLLTGMIRCAECGSRMNGGHWKVSGEAKGQFYRCSNVKTATHPGTYVSGSQVDTFVIKWFNKYAKELNAAAAKSIAETKLYPVKNQTAGLLQKASVTQAKIDRLSMRAVETEMPKDVYQRLLGTLTDELTQINQALGAATAQQTRRPLAIHPNVQELWPHITVAERREILKALIDVVEVDMRVRPARIEITPL